MKNRYYKYLLFLLLIIHQSCGSSPAVPNISGAKEPTAVGLNSLVLTPSVSSSVQKLTYKIGPFSLPAGQKAITMWEAPASINFQAGEPLWITSFEDSIEESAGTELPKNLLHMAIISNRSEKNPLCLEKEIGNPFFAATSSTGKIELPDGVGYPVQPDDQLDAKVILRNPTTQDFNNVYYKFTITAVPKKSSKGINDVIPLLLDIDPCDHLPIALPPKEFVKKTADFTVPEDGLLIKAYGLLQDNGVEVSLSEQNESSPLWEASPELTEKHELVSLPQFEDPAGIPLNTGDEITLKVAYENPDDSWYNDATGAVMIYLKKTDGKNLSLKEVQQTLISE